MSSELTAGAVFAGRYRIERCIAKGGMGAVYEAVHVETNRRCAVKVMHAHYVEREELRARFRQEARLAAEVESDYIVTVFDAGIDEPTGMPFIVMELLRGKELGIKLKEDGPLSHEEVVLYLHQVALALDKTHKRNIVHRDLKPNNLFLCESDEGPARIKILDFGIAKVLADGQSQADATTSLGTPLYMAPEQFATGGSVSAATDIFALGMIAYTLLVGKPYWREEFPPGGSAFALAVFASMGPQEAATVRAHRQGVVLPPDFNAFFAKATAKNPRERFPSASAAVTGLAEALGLPPPARRTLSTATASVQKVAPASKAEELQTVQVTLQTAEVVAPVEKAMTPAPATTRRASVPAILGGALGTFLLAGLALFALRPSGPPPASASSEPATSALPAPVVDVAPPVGASAEAALVTPTSSAATTTKSGAKSPKERATTGKTPAPAPGGRIWVRD